MIYTNKFKICVAWLLLAVVCLQAQEPTAGIRVGSPILPGGSRPTHVGNWGYGGWHITTNLASIPDYLLAEGTASWNITDTNLYIYNGTTWDLFAQGDMFFSDFVQGTREDNTYIVDHADYAEYANESGQAIWTYDSDRLDGHHSDYFLSTGYTARVSLNDVLSIGNTASNTIDVGFDGGTNVLSGDFSAGNDARELRIDVDGFAVVDTTCSNIEFSVENYAVGAWRIDMRSNDVINGVFHGDGAGLTNLTEVDRISDMLERRSVRFVAISTNVSPAIDGLVFYDTLTTTNGEAIYMDAGGVYAYWNHPTDGMLISAVTDVGGSPTDCFKEQPPADPIVVDAGGCVLTYTALDANTTSLTGFTGTPVDVVVPTEHDGRAVVRLDEYLFEGATSLVSITAPSVTDVNESCFLDCTSLASVKMTAVESIADDCFMGCTSLSSIVLPATLRRLEYCVFSGCSSLNTIRMEGDAPALDPSVFEDTPATIYYPSTATGYANPWGERPTVAYVPGALTGFGLFSGSLITPEGQVEVVQLSLDSKADQDDFLNTSGRVVTVESSLALCVDTTVETNTFNSIWRLVTLTNGVAIEVYSKSTTNWVRQVEWTED